MTAAAQTTARDVTSLNDRVGLLVGVRIAIVAVVLAATQFASDVVGALPADVLEISAAYVGLTVGAELIRRGLERRMLGLLSLSLLVDGLYIALILVHTGGARSPFLFLTHLHLIAVTVLLSYRTGLKIAVWHSILMLGGYYADRAELWPSITGADGRVSAPDEVAVFSAIAFWLLAIGTAVFTATSERELRRRQFELSTLADLGAALEEAPHPQHVLEELVRTVNRMGFDRVAAVVPVEGEWLISSTETRHVIASHTPADEVDHTIARARKERVPLLLRSLHPTDDPLLSAALPNSQNIVVVPLTADGQQLGTLVAEWSGGRRSVIVQHTVALLAQVAAHASLALRNAALLVQVERMATIDALTGLSNRRVFDDVLLREVARSFRRGEPLSLVLLDIDHFKQVNDEHGHQVGDEVLRAVSASLKAACRDADLPVRFGGEELAVLMPGCSALEALVAAERLREAIGVAIAPVPVTASAGVATVPVNARNGEALLAAADQALYRSKADGRNRSTQAWERADGADEASVAV